MKYASNCKLFIVLFSWNKPGYLTKKKWQGYKLKISFIFLAGAPFFYALSIPILGYRCPIEWVLGNFFPAVEQTTREFFAKYV